jgi:hypothetical protein
MGRDLMADEERTEDPMVRIHAYEYRIGRFELREQRPFHKGREVPRSLWEAMLAADAAAAEAIERQGQATLAVVRYVAERHPDDEVFTEWARMGMEAF